MARRPFNTGRDCTLVFQGADGTRIDMSKVTRFMADATDKLVRSEPMTSPPIQINLPNGWQGSFELDRNGNGFDALIGRDEATYWATGDFGTGDLFQFVSEPDGSTTTWHFVGISYKLKGGQWMSDGVVKQTLEFVASQRIAV